MRTVHWMLAALLLSSAAHAEGPVFPGAFPDYKKYVEACGGYVFSQGDGQWHPNSSTYPYYVSGAVSSSALPSGAATAAKQPALGTAGAASADVISVQGVASMVPILTVPEWNAVNMKATTRSTISSSQANSSLTTNCTGACNRCQVCNIGTTNPICVKTVSGSTGPLLYARAAATSPPMCYAFRNVTNIYADSSSSGCTGGSDVEITCEDD